MQFGSCGAAGGNNGVVSKASTWRRATKLQACGCTQARTLSAPQVTSGLWTGLKPSWVHEPASASVQVGLWTIAARSNEVNPHFSDKNKQNHPFFPNFSFFPSFLFLSLPSKFLASFHSSRGGDSLERIPRRVFGSRFLRLPFQDLDEQPGPHRDRKTP